jgi:hypothetical protein
MVSVKVSRENIRYLEMPTYREIRNNEAVSNVPWRSSSHEIKSVSHEILKSLFNFSFLTNLLRVSFNFKVNYIWNFLICVTFYIA